MIRLQQLINALDHVSQDLTSSHETHAAHIAAVGTRAREQLVVACGATQQLSTPAELFDICTILDSDPDLAVHAELQQEVTAYRLSALISILHAHYKEAIRASPDHARDISRESEIVFILARVLPEIRKKVPVGRFGPEALREILGAPTYQKIYEFLYNLDVDSLDWSHFTVFLPRDLRERFDAEDNGIEIPDEITSTDQAVAILRMISERKGIALRKLLDPAHFVEHCKRMPGFEKAAAFLLVEERKCEEPQKRIRQSPPAS